MAISIAPVAEITEEARRHRERHAAAVLTMQPPTIPRDVSFDTHIRPDGRTCWPLIVQYRLASGELVDLPPTKDSHPDHARYRQEGPLASLPYKLVIHDLDAYHELARSGLLYSDAHVGGSAVVTENRRFGSDLQEATDTRRVRAGWSMEGGPELTAHSAEFKDPTASESA